MNYDNAVQGTAHRSIDPGRLPHTRNYAVPYCGEYSNRPVILHVNGIPGLSLSFEFEWRFYALLAPKAINTWTVLA